MSFIFRIIDCKIIATDDTKLFASFFKISWYVSYTKIQTNQQTEVLVQQAAVIAS